MNTIVALVGRPNVGKSTLFNRLVGRRQAVEAPISGTTRDRIQAEVSWKGHYFTLLDMAGLEPVLTNDTQLHKSAQNQVKKGLDQADILAWVVDGQQGVTLEDESIFQILKRTGKELIIVVNKSDLPKHDEAAYEFARFGLEQVITVSSIHNRGINELLDYILNIDQKETISEEIDTLKIAVVGRPNVGKSTLLNRLVHDERSVVSEISGTTRDAIDVDIPAKQFFNQDTEWSKVTIIDTAGMRRPGKLGKSIERWSVARTTDSIYRADVVLCMIDATEKLVRQDLHILQEIENAGKAVILLVNKWDSHSAKQTIEQEDLQDAYLTTLRSTAPFLFYAPVIFVSALEGLNVDYISKVVQKVYLDWSLQLTDEELREAAMVFRKIPQFNTLKKITQPGSKPPVFHIHLQTKKMPHFSAFRRMDSLLREFYDIGSTPIKVWAKVLSDKKRGE